ncbi:MULTISPECIES: hypothetical protein [unclassified Saccharopolyspora]|uniref:hypothetical protein n=1 Tax=unclassified Saccharopolyspora TaxID=2646250 RepID=UPI001CD1B841|nr:MULTISPECIES: hypothetical protein [unclassified Saccharopolyspora]MCA1188407.1 hypothetical protein [Saccharopolyspora sp. 6T]MCA1194817.1 hypothetical protein [Saccharopolyspora sp. 6V]MCA1228976.1 hypothetical protein [Saccharopolyspora sp. 6M]MCA1281281.1 hypothetical protein [Saccharopolyspora sp. 7B]
MFTALTTLGTVIGLVLALAVLLLMSVSSVLPDLAERAPDRERTRKISRSAEFRFSSPLVPGATGTR